MVKTAAIQILVSNRTAGTTNVLFGLRLLFERQQVLRVHVHSGRINTAPDDWQTTAIQRHHAHGCLNGRMRRYRHIGVTYLGQDGYCSRATTTNLNATCIQMERSKRPE